MKRGRGLCQGQEASVRSPPAPPSSSSVGPGTWQAEVTVAGDRLAARAKTWEDTLPPMLCFSSRTPCWKDALSHGTLQQAWASLKKSH